MEISVLKCLTFPRRCARNGEQAEGARSGKEEKSGSDGREGARGCLQDGDANDARGAGEEGGGGVQDGSPVRADDVRQDEHAGTRNTLE